MKTVLVIPVLNEKDSIGQVLNEVPSELFDDVLVVDNGSTDGTAEVAAAQGVKVLREPQKGYGNACMRAIRELPPSTEAVVFMDGDGSDIPNEALKLLQPIADHQADFVLGSRELGCSEAGALGRFQRLGNLLATWLINRIYGHRYTDLGPFRAISALSLQRLKMSDPNYGWTVEMQIRALHEGLIVKEIPVSYRKRRTGVSKVSGSLWGGLLAGLKILWLILRLSQKASDRQQPRRQP